MAQASNNSWIEVRSDDGPTVYQFDSPEVGDRLEITVVAPPGYAGGTLPLPTLYALDPFVTLEMVIGLSKLFGLVSEGQVPPALVVGVGCPMTHLQDWFARRARDLTPTSQGFPAELPLTPPLGLGGASRFLRSLVEEVIPGIQARYHVHLTDRTVIGYSFSGLFGLYVLFHRPETFARYLLVSPSIWWDEEVTFTYEQAWAEQHTALPAKVFLALGEGEERPGQGWLNENIPDELFAKLRPVHRLQELASRLKQRSYPNLIVHHMVFPDEYHLTVFPAALSQGLRQLFGQDHD